VYIREIFIGNVEKNENMSILNLSLLERIKTEMPQHVRMKSRYFWHLAI